MGTLYELADSLESKTFGKKILIGFLILLFFVLTYVAVYYVGKSKGKNENATVYNEETQKREAKITELETTAKVHSDNETQLLAENALLKRDIEAKAEVLKTNDAKLNVDAKKLDTLTQDRLKKVQDINLDNDFQNQLKGLCDDYKASGIVISFCKDIK